MKLNTRDAARYFAKPDADKTGLLIYGADAMRVALRRQEVVRALIGPNGDDEMRLTRIQGADLGKDPALIGDAIKAQGFFPGPRVALVEDAQDSLAATLTAALSDWAPGDAQVVVTAGSLAARSSLRKLFEGHDNAYAVGIYDDPPCRQEIEDTLKTAGLTDIGRDAMGDLETLARALDPGDFRQTVDRIALYKIGDDTPLSSEEFALLAPSSIDAEIDDVLNIVAEAPPRRNRTRHAAPDRARGSARRTLYRGDPAFPDAAPCGGRHGRRRRRHRQAPPARLRSPARAHSPTGPALGCCPHRTGAPHPV